MKSKFQNILIRKPKHKEIVRLQSMTRNQVSISDFLAIILIGAKIITYIVCLEMKLSTETSTSRERPGVNFINNILRVAISYGNVMRSFSGPTICFFLNIFWPIASWQKKLLGKFCWNLLQFWDSVQKRQGRNKASTLFHSSALHFVSKKRILLLRRRLWKKHTQLGWHIWKRNS